jgi:hypothetical protein
LDSNDLSLSGDLIAELEALNLRSVEDDGVYQRVRRLMARYGARQTGLNPSNRFYRIRKTEPGNIDELLVGRLEWLNPDDIAQFLTLVFARDLPAPGTRYNNTY